MKTLSIASAVYSDDLVGYQLTLTDGRFVQIQFERQTNRLHAAHGELYMVIDKENEYGLNLTDDECDQVLAWARLNLSIPSDIS
jgi:hypothetical protein